MLQLPRQVLVSLQDLLIVSACQVDVDGKFSKVTRQPWHDLGIVVLSLSAAAGQ
jgi:hypothetical protein